MKQIVIDFNRYRGLGFKPREALSVAVMRFRVQRLLERELRARELAKQRVVRG